MTVGPYPQQYPALLQMGISPTGQQGMVFGREVVETIGAYSAQYKICGDLDYWCRAMAAGFRFIFYPLEAGRFRLQGGQISGDVRTLRDELRRIARIHFPRGFPFYRRSWQATYCLYNAPRYFQDVEIGLQNSINCSSLSRKMPSDTAAVVDSQRRNVSFNGGFNVALQKRTGLAGRGIRVTPFFASAPSHPKFRIARV
jgi:hypothetical protein